MEKKIIVLFIVLVQITLVLNAQQKNYKITYRHCFMSDTSKILSDTSGMEATLIGNSKSSNYSFLKNYGGLKNNTPNGQPKTFEDVLKAKQEGTFKLKIGSSADSIGNIVFHDKLNDSVFVREKMPKNYVLTTEKTPVINWLINNETKLIQGHPCQKAITHFRGRNYIAWFAKDLPIADGPWKFYGLPGLIMDIYDDKNQLKIYVDKIEYPSMENVPAFEAIGNRISLLDYFTYKDKAIKKEKEAMFALLLAQDNLPEGVTPTVTGKTNSALYPIEKSLD